ncbi:hypothetical protein KIPB_015333, partial [Kipferlia bialata]
GEAGFFRILRGSNECGIEKDIVCGDPLLPEPTLSLEAPILSNSIIEKVNSNPESTWKAARNARFEGVTVREAKAMLMTIPKPSLPEISSFKNVSVPSSFDS